MVDSRQLLTPVVEINMHMYSSTVLKYKLEKLVLYLSISITCLIYSTNSTKLFNSPHSFDNYGG